MQMQRQHLLDLRDRALDNMSGVARDTLRNHPAGSEASGSGEHQADAGSDAYDRDFALSLLSKELGLQSTMALSMPWLAYSVRASAAISRLPT